MFIQVFSYKQWADRRTLDAVAAMQGAETAASLAFARQQLNHMVRVEELFKARLLGEAAPHASTHTVDVPDLDELDRRITASNLWLTLYVESLDPACLDQAVEFEFVDGLPGTLSRREILFHLVNHGTYHRGAVGHALERAGAMRPPDTYTVFLHAAEPSRRERPGRAAVGPGQRSQRPSDALAAITSGGLTGPRLLLRPLQATDAAALVAAASDGGLWNLPYTVVPSAATVDAYIARALQGRATGTVLPFVTVLRDTGQVVGSTRFWKIDRQNRTLEIGGTWLAASWQKSFVNTEAKFLMLQAAFDDLGCIRVQFTTDETNAASRAAILRLGAQEEGVLRNERLMPDGRKRHSVRFSLIDDEWPAVKTRLQQRLLR